MAIQSESCPSCGASVEVPDDSNRTKCPYCSASLTIERSKGEIAITVAEKITGSIESSGNRTKSVIQESTIVTQTELKRLQLLQELSTAQLRLANLNAEIRSLKRAKSDPLIKQQMTELNAQEFALRQHIDMLQESIAPEVGKSSASGQGSTPNYQQTRSIAAPLTKPTLSDIARNGAIAIVSATVVNVILFYIGAALGGFPSDVLTPMGTPLTVMNVVIMTVATIFVGAIGYAILNRFVANPNLWFVVTSVLIFIAFIPSPFSIAGAPVLMIVVLEVMHVVAAAAAIYFLTRS